MNNNSSNNSLVIIVIVLVVGFLCACCLCLGFGYLATLNSNNSSTNNQNTTTTPVAPQPTTQPYSNPIRPPTTEPTPPMTPPTPAPTQSWHLISNLTGAMSKVSPSFYYSGSKFKVAYQFGARAMGSSLSIDVVKSSGGYSYPVAVLAHDNNEVIFNNNLPGYYYLNVTSHNTDWSVQVYELY